jgi:hypothetical protein
MNKGGCKGHLDALSGCLRFRWLSWRKSFWLVEEHCVFRGRLKGCKEQEYEKSKSIKVGCSFFPPFSEH